MSGASTDRLFIIKPSRECRIRKYRMTALSILFTVQPCIQKGSWPIGSQSVLHSANAVDVWYMRQSKSIQSSAVTHGSQRPLRGYGRTHAECHSNKHCNAQLHLSEKYPPSFVVRGLHRGQVVDEVIIGIVPGREDDRNKRASRLSGIEESLEILSTGTV